MKRLAIAFVSFIGLALGVRALLPWGVEELLQRSVLAELGLAVELGEVDLVLWRGQLRLEGVVVERAVRVAAPAPEGEGEVLRARVALADLSWFALWDGRIGIEALDLEGPALRLRRGADGRIESPLRRPPQPEADDGADWPVALARVTLRDATLAIVDAGDAGPWIELAFDELLLERLSFEAGHLGLAEARLRRPVLAVARRAAPAGAVEPAAGAEPDAAAESDGAAPSFGIGQLRIEEARVELEGDGADLTLALDLEAREIDAERFPLEVELTSGEGRIAFEGEVDAATPALEGQLRWQELALAPLAGFADAASGARLASGHTRGEGELTLRLGGESPAARLVARAAVDDLGFADPARGDLSLAWKTLELAALDATWPLGGAGAPRIAVKGARLGAPRASLTLPDALQGGRQASGPEPRIRIASLGIEGGELRLRDRGVEPPFETRLRDLKGEVAAIRIPEGAVEGVDLRGLAPDAALFAVRGDLGPEASELRIEADRLALPHLDPYARGAGYVLRAGDATLASHVRLGAQRYDLENEVTFHRLDVETLDADLFRKNFGLSLDLALALLRDPGGDIRLRIPVHGEAGASRVRLRSVLRDALREALLGALATPLKVVGAGLTLGRDREGVSFDPLVAQPGVPELAEGELPRLERLAGFLRERPRLGLTLEGRAGPADRGEPPPDAPGPPDVAAGPPADPALQALARARAERVRETLLAAGVEPARLRIAEPVREAAPGVGIELHAN